MVAELNDVTVKEKLTILFFNDKEYEMKFVEMSQTGEKERNILQTLPRPFFMVPAIMVEFK